MKKILFYIIACATTALSLTSCYDTMDDKNEVEQGFAGNNLPVPTVTLSNPNSTWSSATITVSVSDTTNVVEYGVQCASTQTFDNASFIAAQNSMKLSNEVTIGNLQETTTYYLRPYVITRNGNTVFGDSQSVTTIASPTFDLNGLYTATDYEYDKGAFVQSGEAYEMEVKFTNDEQTAVAIVNLWGSEGTIYGTYDKATNTITAPTEQPLMEHPNYGVIFMLAVNSTITGYEDNVTFVFNPKGGVLQSSNYGAVCDLGSFGYFNTTMTRK